MKPVLLIGGAIAAAGIAAGVAYVVVPGGGEEETLQQVATATPSTETASPSSRPASPSASSAPTAAPTPATTVAQVPSDWVVYDDPGGFFSVAYPPDWYEKDGHFYSEDPETLVITKDGFPAEVVKVDVGYDKVIGSSGCGGSLDIDPRTGQGTPVTGATPTMLGGLAAWKIDRQPGDPLLNDPATRIVGISLIYQTYCFTVAAYFTQQQPDVDTFLKIVSTFQLRL